MKSVKYILDEKWQILLRKAKADLNAATILYRENGISKEVVMFHLEQAVESIHKIIENITYEEFKGNDLLVSAVILKFEIVGELAKNISEELRNKDNGINWKDLIEYRNYLIDNYFDVDLITLWKKSNNALVKLKEKLLILKDNIKN